MNTIQKNSHASSRTATTITITLLLIAALCTGFYFYTRPAAPASHATEKVFAAPDGTVQQVKDYIKHITTKGEEDLQFIHWSPLQKREGLDDTGYSVSVIYKTRDNNGEWKMWSKTFSLDGTGLVMMEWDVEPFKGRN